MNKSKFFIGFLAASLVIMLFMGYNMGKRLNSQQIELDKIRSDFEYKLHELKGEINREIEDQLNQQTNMVSDFEFDWVEADLTNKQAKLALQVELKEIEPDAKYFLSYRSAVDTKEQQIPLKHKAGTSFTADLHLSLTDNYELDVWQGVLPTGQKKLNASPLLLPIYDQAYSARVINQGNSFSTDNVRANVSFEFGVRNLPVTEMNIKQAVLRVFNGDGLIDEVLVTDKLVRKSKSVMVLEDQYRIAIASGEVDPSVTLEQFIQEKKQEQEQASEPSTELNNQESEVVYSLDHTITYNEDYKELKLDQESVKKLTYRLVIQFMDGYEFILN